MTQSDGWQTTSGSEVDFLRALHTSRVNFGQCRLVEVRLRIGEDGEPLERVSARVEPMTGEVTVTLANGAVMNRFADGLVQTVYPTGRVEYIERRLPSIHPSLDLFYHERLGLWGKDRGFRSESYAISMTEIRQIAAPAGRIVQDSVVRGWLKSTVNPGWTAMCEVDTGFGLRSFVECYHDGSVRREIVLDYLESPGRVFDRATGRPGSPFDAPMEPRPRE